MKAPNVSNEHYAVNDYLWPVIEPRNGSTDAVSEMNAKWLAYAPDSPARQDHELFQYAKRIVFDEGDISLANIFRCMIRE